MLRKTITILETSDIHGNVLPINYGNNEERDLGLAKVATVIKNERSRTKHTLLIDNGDLIQGTPLTYHYVRYKSDIENPMSLILNHLNYDVAVIGNHEFNYGMDLLQSATKSSNFPWLSANILDSKTGEPFFGKPYIIKRIDDLKIAILGVTTHYIPNWENPLHIEGLEFVDAFNAAKNWVTYIKEVENPDLLIVSYHGGFENDLETGEPTENLTGENQGYKMCYEIEGIDVLLTGHQHRSIAAQVNGVYVLQPSYNGEKIGKVEIQFVFDQNKWLIEMMTPELLSVDTVEPDQEILRLIEPYEVETQKWLDKTIGRINGDMNVNDPFKIRLSDHPLIEFINKVQMEVSGASISNTSLFNNTSPGFKQDVTMRDIVANYIYPNTLKVVRITGKDIKAALERSASYFILNKENEIEVNPSFSKPKPQHYNYDMWEGIEYILDIRQPLGHRVVKLNYEGLPINEEKEYDVVMNNYRALGGGEYTMYKNKQIVKDIPMDMSELIANYIMEKGTIDATLNHNWKVEW